MFRNGPFTLTEARAAGLERWHLEGANWRRVGPQTYAAADLPDSPMARLLAAGHRLPQIAAFSGLTAGWLHGLDVSPCEPIEVTIPKGAGVSARAGLTVRRSRLTEADVVLVNGMRVTAPLRTVVDLAAGLELVEAVV